MTDFGAFILAIGIFLCGCAIDNGLCNIAHAIRDSRKRNADKDSEVE